MFGLMITIQSRGLAALIDKRQPLDLIDVRTKQEFRSFHIRGAQSFPLRELSAAKVLQGRKRDATEPLYIICNNRVRASLAAGMLTGAGCRQPVVVDGGMNTWVRQGLPVVCKKPFWNFARECFRRGLIGVTRGVALVISGSFCAVASMVVSFQRSLEAKLDMVNPIPSKPR
jgi:rhodanese-related sulfurtransferase